MASEEATNWRIGLSLKDKLRYMFDGQYATDVTFKFDSSDSQECIHAHRAILICGSPVFDTMLQQSSDMKQVQEVKVNDEDSDTFRQMLRYLYCEEIDFKDGNISALLQIAKKYDVTRLEEACSTFLRMNIDDENVCSLLNKAVEVKDDELAQTCVHHISMHAEDVMKSQNFNKLTQTSLLKVIANDRLNYGDETEVLQACISWAEAQCKQSKESVSDEVIREKLGDVLYSIRFPTMTGKEFSAISRKYSILTATERVEIYDSIMEEDKKTSECQSESLFSEKPRLDLSTSSDDFQFRNSKKVFISCFWDRPLSLQFSTDKVMIMEGLLLLRSIIPVTKQARIQVFDGEDVVADSGIVSMYDPGVSPFLTEAINDLQKEKQTSDNEDDEECSDDDKDDQDNDGDEDDNDDYINDNEDSNRLNDDDFVFFINFPTPPELLPGKTYGLKAWVSGEQTFSFNTFKLRDSELKIKSRRRKHANMYNMIAAFRCRSKN